VADNPGEEFRIKATPGPELARKLVYLAAQENDSVLTAQKPGHSSGRGADADRKSRAEMMLARLADPAYQAMSQRINEKLDQMDGASVLALQEIEEGLTALRRERQRMLEQAYRDEQGRLIFMTKDGAAAYYEDGTRLEDGEFARHEDQLQGKPTWDELQANRQGEDALMAERDLIHQHEAAREELREAVTQGSISKEEAEQRERELEEALPERVRDHFRRLRGETADHDAGAHAPRDAGSDLALSAEEEARHNTGLSSPGFAPG
jgi:hypothetical protein